MLFSLFSDFFTSQSNVLLFLDISHCDDHFYYLLTYDVKFVSRFSVLQCSYVVVVVAFAKKGFVFVIENFAFLFSHCMKSVRLKINQYN